MAKEKKDKPLGIGAYAKQLLMDGLSNADVLKEVKKKFPKCGANSGTIGWYRSNLKTSGKKVKNSRDITKKERAAAAPAAKKPVKKAAKSKAAPAVELPEPQSTATAVETSDLT